jgi:hypothetical protein
MVAMALRCENCGYLISTFHEYKYLVIQFFFRILNTYLAIIKYMFSVPLANMGTSEYTLKCPKSRKTGRWIDWKINALRPTKS